MRLILLLTTMLTACAEQALHPAHVAFPIEQLIPDGAPVHSTITMSVEPVSLGRFTSKAAFSDGTHPTVAARVVTSPPVNGKWSLPPDIEPKLAGTTRSPRFEARTVPTLPYGSFFVEITNGEKKVLFLSPKQLTLVLGDKRFRGAQDDESTRLWSATIAAYPKEHLGAPWIDVELQTVHGALPIFDKEIEIGAGSTWRGFAVFDLGVYTADDFSAVLAVSQKAELVLAVDGAPVARRKFRVASEKRPALCLPGTGHPTHARCEVIEPIHPAAN